MNLNRLSLAFTLASTLALSIASHATQVVDLGENGTAPALNNMVDGTVYFRWTMRPFDQAFAGSPLNLYPGYREPIMNPELAAVTNSITRIGLTMYVAHASVVINRPFSRVSRALSTFADPATLQTLDPDITYVPVDAATLAEINQRDRSQENAPATPWCGAGTTCLTAQFRLPGPERTAFQMHYAFKNRNSLVAGRTTLQSLQAQVEVRQWNATQGDSRLTEIQRLTGITSSEASVLVQSHFRFNISRVRFARVIAVTQPHPTNPNKTILTGTVAFAMTNELLAMRVPVSVQDYVLGRSRINRETGVTSGLPAYTLRMSQTIAQALMR